MMDGEQGSIAFVTKPAKFADFEVIELLGEGSFGRVYRVCKKDSGKMYALKSMKKQTLINSN